MTYYYVEIKKKKTFPMLLLEYRNMNGSLGEARNAVGTQTVR